MTGRRSWSACSRASSTKLAWAVRDTRQPTVRRAGRTLTLIVGILLLLLGGLALLVRAYGITATVPGQAGYQSVVSQVVGAVMGRGVFYYVTMTAVLMVLALSANTSFADFPRVCRVLAAHRYLPPEFARRGSRLDNRRGTGADEVAVRTDVDTPYSEQAGPVKRTGQHASFFVFGDQRVEDG